MAAEAVQARGSQLFTSAEAELSPTRVSFGNKHDWHAPGWFVELPLCHRAGIRGSFEVAARRRTDAVTPGDVERLVLLLTQAPAAQAGGESPVLGTTARLATPSHLLPARAARTSPARSAPAVSSLRRGPSGACRGGLSSSPGRGRPAMLRRVNPGFTP